jgi:methylmalonyl-CoA/ethylmalonyl-CoA epimerase
MIKGLDHLGIAVTDLDAAIAQWIALTGGILMHREVVASQQVEVAVITIGALRIELLQPQTESSPIAKFIARRGAGIHHLALEAAPAQAELDRLKTAGVQLIDEHLRPGAEHTEVGFLHPRAAGGVLLEFVEHPDR